jgi:hypothetical protein
VSWQGFIIRTSDLSIERPPLYRLSYSACAELHLLFCFGGFFFCVFFVLAYLPFGIYLFSKPPMTEVREILFATPRISFYGFLMAIAKSETINEHIGKS